MLSTKKAVRETRPRSFCRLQQALAYHAAPSPLTWLKSRSGGLLGRDAVVPVPPACTNRRVSERRGGKPCVSVKSICSRYLIGCMIP